MKITNCRFCNSEQLELVISLGEQYLSHFVNLGKDKGEAYPLNLVLCQNCSLLQLDYTVPSGELYGEDYGYLSGISETIKTDLKNIAEETMLRSHLDIGKLVLDIGSNDATCLKFFPKDIIRVGIDPIAKFEKYYDEKNLHFINDYFNFEAFNKHFPNQKAKAITIVSCFYDLDKPNDFVGDLVKVLDENGIIIIQQNYLGAMLLQNGFENCVHEHLSYQSSTSLEYLLERHGLEAFDVRLNDTNGGSFRTFICKKGERKVQDSVFVLKKQEEELGLKNKEIYEQFANRIKNIANTIHDFIEKEVEQGKTVYTIAASTRGNTLLQYCRLDSRLVKGAMERNREKFGKIIASVGIPIVSEEKTMKENPSLLLVLPWFFENQLRGRYKEYLEDGGRMLFPLPYPKLITKEGEIEL